MGRFAAWVVVVATALLVGVPVVAGFWSTEGTAHSSVSAITCLDMSKPANLTAVRTLPLDQIARYATKCNLTFSKSCSASGNSTPTCTIRDKTGTVVRTYTIPEVEVARRLGHTVDILRRIYVGSFRNDEQEANALIERALYGRWVTSPMQLVQNSLEPAWNDNPEQDRLPDAGNA